MKKILLSAVALFATMTVNAQEVGQILTDDLVNRIGLTTDKNDEGKSIKNDVAAGTVFCESENVTMSAAFDDSYSPENAASPKIDDQNYGTIKIGDFTIDAKQAVQGNSNPKDVDGGNPATASTVPAGGAVFQFDVKKDGYLYVFHKATSNKNYMAYENKAAMGYVYTMSTDGTKALPKVFGYELKGEGEYNYLPEGTAVKTPEKYQLGDDAEEQKLNGLSVIKIPVFAGCSYWVNATGSKMTSCGYYFDTTGDATITIDNGVSGELTLLDKGQIPGAEPTPVDPGEEGGSALIWEENLAGLDAVPYWFGSSEGTDATAEATADGIALMNPRKQDQIWTPQTVVTADAFTVEEDHNYLVVIEVKVPAGEGTYQVQLGSWATNFQKEVPVVGNDDWQTLEIEFPEYGGTTDENAAHVVFQNGWVVGTSVVKSVKVFEVGGETAIQSVKKAAKANGAIYNLAGQKVNASYKGVVIKDGKKYIQK